MLTIHVEGNLEERLKKAAASAHADPQSLARKLLNDSLPIDGQNTLEVLNAWEASGHTTDPEELARRTADGDRLMQNLARNREAAEGPSARKI